MKALTTLMTVAAAMLALPGCQEAPPVERAEVARPAKLFTVKAPGVAYLRSFPAEVKATDQAELAFRVSGEIVEFPATRGMRVNQGDLLARLDPADYEARVRQEEAQYELAKSQFERARELVERQLIAQAEYDQRLAKLRVSESNLTQARNNLNYTRIHAPFDGVVARRMAEAFEFVSPWQVVLVLQTGDRVDVTVDVPESIIARVDNAGAERDPKPVTVRFESAPDRTYQATYKEHEAQADPATLTYKVTFSMPSPSDLNVLPGMAATLIADVSGLFGEEAEGHLVPVEAVFSAEDTPLSSETRYVWKLDPDTMRAHRTGVRVGSLTADSVAVLEGLESGDLLVAAGVGSVTEGMLLKPMQREAGL
ncbi:MAG: efflux RND transporter periplasmic adaptor subunit [Xanthomonadales bacterium]|nr:efflux RND transporter periplasmic adaptor subunit [Xanthomonadales bacterium]NIN59719.1 efflux RND transporter periplasmic adaptor subunit [Xanthomonadales bacterium]NIN75488.1 efflux RND transporter periplasmic adaptor subunit [Xanthomonadales bacterium]NIO15177.1 efflux RND transporter periplasmic adaptor subunit [Xanthomonadales bacterium]NIP12112.1 efflux RND transporter periplasmic adaptor subunit [Xanthomonadales bacterium]